MNLGWLIVAGVGLVVLGGSVAFARQPVIGATERHVFHAFNGLPDVLYWPLWLPMQLGNLAVGTGAGLIVAFIDRDLAVAVGVILAMAFKLVTERIVRREMADYLAVRQRPGTSQVGCGASWQRRPELRTQLPVRARHPRRRSGCGGGGEPPLSWAWLPALAVVLVMLGRVYVGAHNPLDVTAGLGAGLILGGIIATFVD